MRQEVNCAKSHQRTISEALLEQFSLFVWEVWGYKVPIIVADVTLVQIYQDSCFLRLHLQLQQFIIVCYVFLSPVVQSVFTDLFTLGLNHLYMLCYFVVYFSM